MKYTIKRKTLNNKHTSMLDYQLSVNEPRPTNPISIEERLKIQMDELENLVTGFLAEAGLPSNNNVKYNFSANYKSTVITLNGVDYNFCPKRGHEELKNTIKGEDFDLPIILFEYFTNIPASDSAAWILIKLENIKKSLKKNDTYSAALEAILAGSLSRNITIAMLEEKYIAENNRQIKSNIPRTKARETWHQEALKISKVLMKKGITSKNTMADIISPKVKRSPSTVRKFLQGK